MSTKRRPRKEAPVARLDGWSNVLTSVGRRGRDPNVSTTFSGALELSTLSESILEDLYRADALARKIIDLPVREMTREGFEIEGDPDGEILAALQEIDGPNKIREWLRWARLHGGALLVMLANDGLAMDRPLNEALLRSIDGFHVFTRWRVNVRTKYANPMLPNYDQPELYEIQPIGMTQPFVIHESRCLRMEGVAVPDRARQNNQGWGDSALTSVWTQLRNVGASDAYSIAVLRDFVQGVMTIGNLASLLATGQEGQIITRLNILDVSRSILNTMLLDKDETFTKVTSSVTGLPDIMDRHREALAAAAEMPMTLLWGRPPSGLSTDDESGMRNWYDRIAGDQESVLQPPLERLVRLMQLAKDGPMRGVELEDWAIKFKPLFQLSDKEEAEIRRINAETDAKYLEAGVLTAEEVRESRWGADKYGKEITIDKTLELPKVEEDDEEQPPANGNGAVGNA